MRDQTKVIIGFGSIWGLFAFGVLLVSAFTIGVNDTAPEILAVVLYGLTILPSCILAIWYRRGPAIWLIVLSFISVFGFVYQGIHQSHQDTSGASFLGHIIVPVVIAAIPGFLGTLLLRTNRSETQ